MSPSEWSEETLRLREEAGVVLDKLARSSQADRARWGRYDDMDDEDKHMNTLVGQQLTAWITVTQYQGFDDPETSCVVLVASGATGATNKGLLGYGQESFT